MTREAWLAGIASAIRYDGRLPYASAYGRSVTLLASFPARATRRVRVGDIVRQEDGTFLGLVSPLLSSNLEVAAVVYWLLVRRDYSMIDERRLTTRNGAYTLSNAGFNVPFNQCIPTEVTLDRLNDVVERYVSQYGDYPAEDVNLPARRTETTRMLKVECAHGHAPYIVRMSQSQLDRGRPICGVCELRMNVAV